MLWRIVTLAVLLVLPATSSAAHAQTSPGDFPLTLTDDSGTSTTFAEPPRRIVSLNPGLTEITFALGHGDALIAVDSYSD